ncbi:MAG: extracellular solute-binding protein [Clostridia bacterium]|nr:extracellular solute-binding protein [Clostridia bacterium]
MNAKRIISLILTLSLVFCLAACGSGDGKKDTGDTTPAHSADGLWLKKFDGVTLKRILWYEPSESEKKLVKEFEDRTGATIVDEIVDYQNYNTKIAASIAANDPYDIGYIYGAFFPTQIIAGMYQPINQFIKSEYLLDKKSKNGIANGGFDISKMDFYKWNNNYYGFSSYWDVDMMVMYYRTDLFKEAGLKTPNEYLKAGNWNQDTFYNLAKQLTNKRTGVYGYSAGGENTRSYAEFVSGQGTQIVAYDSNGVPSQNLGDSKVLAGLNFIKKLTDPTNPVVDANASFRKGTAAMSIDGLYEAPKMMNDKNVPDVVKKNWDIAPIPLAKGNEKGAYPTDWLKAIGVVNGSKNAEAVAAFALHMTKGRGDNSWETYLTKDQIERITPYYENINYANYAYGTLGEEYVQMIARIAGGDDVSQLISEYKTSFKAQIDKIING